MMTTIRLAVPRKGRPLEAVLDQIATRAGIEDVADEVASTLRYEKAVTKGTQSPELSVYERLAAYSDASNPYAPEYTILRDSRQGMPRRIVFDSLEVEWGGVDLHLVGREEPFRALRKHEFALGFDSADLVLEEVVSFSPEPLSNLAELNDRIDPRDTDVRVAGGLGDRVHHTLLSHPNVTENPTREFLEDYEGPLCISPRYERLVEAVLGTDTTEGIEFRYTSSTEPDTESTAVGSDKEEAAIAAVGIGVYLTVTGGTAREHGLRVGEQLFPSETVLLENAAEGSTLTTRFSRELVDGKLATPELS
ncbi:MAG: hypothetical protein ACLFNI_05205 [Natronomonas sp.]